MHKQFEIWTADLNPKFGTEPGKTRPVLILQNDILNQIHPSCLICPITTVTRNNVSILRVNILKKSSGLKKDSAVMIDQIRAIDNKRLLKKIGDLPIDLHDTVKENIKIIMNL